MMGLKALESNEFKKYFPEPANLMTKLGVLFHDIGKPICTRKKGDRIQFIGHDKAGAKMMSKICKDLALGSASYYPFNCADLVWIV